MKKLTLLLFAISLHSQPWSGIISAGRAIDWTQTTGIPGGIPSGSWTQSGSTIAAGSSNTTIQNALNACGTNHYVLLAAGTFTVSGLTVPSNCALRGAGADQTILSESGTGNTINLGNTQPSLGTNTSVTGGASQGSTSITVASNSGISVGGYLIIDQQNDGSVVTNAGSEGTCTWCDGGQNNGTYAQGQIVEVTSVSGTTIGITPGLYTAYTHSPVAIPFSATKYAGVENVQFLANNTGKSAHVGFLGCAYCWVSGVEGNYADGDHIEADWSFRGQIQNSYFSNAYLHVPGSFDSDVALRDKTSGFIVQNNILERLHVSVLLEWGAAGNVTAHNYILAAFDSGATSAVMGGVVYHGAHPQFNLEEGNVTMQIYYDSVWGTSSNSTAFRNWVQGSAKLCSPLTAGRNPVTCGTSSFPFQTSRAFQVSYLASSDNFVGNVVGSPAQQNNVGYGGGVTSVDSVQWPTTRIYDTTVYGWSFGYGEASDSGSGSGDSTNAFDTAFQHGTYSNITSSTTWASGVTHTLPASFYLTAKPSWWGSTPYPAIGPDVTGGSGPGGHAYAIPAQVCYAAMGGSDGSANSPLSFNAATCYGGGGSPAPPPTSLTAIVR